MDDIRDQRAIIDRRALAGRLAAIAERDRPAEERAAVLAELKSALATGRAEVRRRFESAADGRQAVRELSFLIDQLLRTLHDFTTTHAYPLANPSAAERLALVAVGGYGRGELAPHSDVDLLFLLPYKLTPHGEQVVEYMLYHLWDLGLKVGHATRSVDDCIRQAKADMTIRTNLLEARYLCGDQELYQELRRRYAKEVVAGTGRAFVEAKLAERDERHRRMGISRYALEPNIKEGKGGLRDLQALFWIAKYLYDVDDVATLVERGVFTAAEAATFDKAEAFLWSVRVGLHYLAGRPEERLSFDLQPELARAPRLHRPCRHPRRRAADEALLPDRQERRRPHAHLLRRARGREPQVRLPPARFPHLPPGDRGLPHRRRPPRLHRRQAADRQARRHAPPLRGGAAPRPRHPSGVPAPDHRRTCASSIATCAPIPRPTACSWRC